MRNFAVFILTHGRADNVITYKTLRNQGYTGKVYFIVDNLDDQIEKYMKNFGEENVIVFDKPDIAKRIDTMDNFDNMKVILFARNACFEIAKKLKLTHFLELDDDYTRFAFRYIDSNQLRDICPKDLDKLFSAFCDCLDETGSLTIAMAQGGDFIGGLDGGKYLKRVLRKAMNSFFCRTDKPFQFIGRINEDVNMYTTLGSTGELIFTVTEASLNQLPTQSNDGGMTDIYLERGTYIKSFYSVIAMPCAVRILLMGGGKEGRCHNRLHHNILWDNCVPKILEEKWKK